MNKTKLDIDNRADKIELLEKNITDLSEKLKYFQNDPNLEDYKSDFVFKKKENGLNIQFNRVAFIFFVFFIIYLIYTIHLVHLGSRKSKLEKINNIPAGCVRPLNTMRN